MKAMLLAAGRGARLRPITDTLPKPLVEIAGRPLVGYHLAALARAGIREVVINTSWLGERLHAALGNGERYGVSITWSDEGPVPYETGGGILRALALLGPEPFLVVNADIWTDIDFGRLAIEPDAWAHLVLVPNPAHHPRGDFALEHGRVTAAGAGRLTYSGVGLYRPELFAGCEPGRFPLLPLLERAIAARRVRGELHRGQWSDLGSVERLAAVSRSRPRVE